MQGGGRTTYPKSKLLQNQRELQEDPDKKGRLVEKTVTGPDIVLAINDESRFLSAWERIMYTTVSILQYMEHALDWGHSRIAGFLMHIEQDHQLNNDLA